MQNLKVLILLLYYERPKLVQNALKSILRANERYPNWELAFIDDSSPTSGRPIAEDILSTHLDKVKFYNTNMTPSEKIRDGSFVGKLMNQAIVDSSSDLVVMLCDDDELVSDYFAQLNRFFSVHPRTPACYSHVHLYNPGFERSEEVDNAPNTYFFNRHTRKIHLAGKVDASQVAWRISVHKKNGIWFDFPKAKNLDESFYGQLSKKYGKIPFSQLIGQYKSKNTVQLKDFDEKAIWEGQSLDHDALKKQTPAIHILQMINRYCRQGKINIARRIKEDGLLLHPTDKGLLERDVRIVRYGPILRR